MPWRNPNPKTRHPGSGAGRHAEALLLRAHTAAGALRLHPLPVEPGEQRVGIRLGHQRSPVRADSLAQGGTVSRQINIIDYKLTLVNKY